MLVVDDESDLELLIKQKFRRQIREGLYQFVFAPNGLPKPFFSCVSLRLMTA